MIAAEETFKGTWPFQARFCRRRGFAQHYVDEGAGQPVVLLHGEPTWGYLYRRFIGPLAATHRVIVPDHMGFGKSETPADRSYLRDEHIDNLEALLVDELDLHDITLAVHDWGGPIGAGFALRHPARVRRIFAMNAPLPLGLPHESAFLEANSRDSHWFRWAGDAHADGSLQTILDHARYTIAHLMLELQGIVHTEVVDPLWIHAYSEPFAGTGEARGAIDFPRQIIAPGEFDTTSPHPPASEVIAAVRAKPVMLAYGLADRALLAQHLIPLFEQSFPGRPVVRLPEAGHFCQEDTPELLIALLQQFIALT